MPQRNPQDPKLKNKRIRDHAKVLRFLMHTDNLTKNATGRLESPQKLVIFYAGYIAMRRIWEVKTNGGKIPTGDPEFDKDKNKDKDCIIYRIDKEVAHPLGLETSTLFRIAKFKYWGRKFLHLCEN
jgi:hypothetical protein